MLRVRSQSVLDSSYMKSETKSDTAGYQTTTLTCHLWIHLIERYYSVR